MTDGRRLRVPCDRGFAVYEERSRADGGPLQTVAAVPSAPVPYAEFAGATFPALARATTACTGSGPETKAM